MAHVNIQIPRLFGEIDRQLEAVRTAATLKFWRETAEYLIRELENIPDAIRDHGYVQLPDGTRLIAEPAPPAAGSEKG